MKALLLTAALAATTAAPMAAQTSQTEPQWPAVTREMKPGSRWWWMGSAVDTPNLQWNIGEYARTGMGTLEITPIYGVEGNVSHELQFLSLPWLQALGTSQQAAAEHDMDIDMNCGTGWPFGGPTVKTADAAGKLVTKNATLTADGTTELTFALASPETGATLNKVMAYQQDGDQAVIDVTSYASGNTLRWAAPAGQWLLLAVYNGHTGQQVKRAAPGGEGLVVDHYSAEAVKNYLSRFDTQFQLHGAQWPHSFFNDSYEVYGADWTPLMFEEFLKYRGYRLEEHMDQLLGLGKRKDEGNQVLADYRQTLSDMLLNNFTRQWADWAHSHGATVRNQGHGSPGNLLDFYAAVDIPEIESFGLSDFKIRGLRQDPGFTSQNLSDLATLKYASSAAHVAGKKLTSSETFTWLAEHFRVSLSQMKPDLDFFFLAGVNHIFFHGTTYSPQEAAWPGWKFYASIDMSPTNTIWHDAPALMQYATRCQSFLQMGSPDNDVLIYAPFQDAMHKNTGANAARLQLFDINTLSQKIPSLPTCVQLLEAAGLDGDYISDAQLQATIYNNGVIVTAAGQPYKALVVPVSTNMPEATRQHLDQLAAQGANIVYGNTAATIAQLGLQGEDMRTQLGLRALRRKNATGHHYFITNLSATDREGYVSLAVPFQGAALFDPMTGRVSGAATQDNRVWLSLRSGESIILQTYDTPVTLPAKAPTVAMDGIEVTGTWTLEKQNSLNNDAIQYELRPNGWQTATQWTAYCGTGSYEVSFSLSPEVLQMGNEGFLIDLGDVRESARVYLNGDSLGTAWSAPFTVDATGHLKQQNTLRVEVTNLPANRISQMDRDGVVWRIFKDVNILDIVNGNTSQAGVTYEGWEPVPSGLLGKVRLIPLRRKATELQAQLTGFEQQGNDYYPTYQLTTPSGQPIETLSVSQTGGGAFDGYTLSADHRQLTVTGRAQDYIVLSATTTAGEQCELYLPARGAYAKRHDLDFTADEAPLCGWQTFTSTQTLQGFSTQTNVWRRATQNGKVADGLYADMTFATETSSYYFYYPGYGMAPSVDCTLTIAAEEGDVALLSQVQGSTDKPAYEEVAPELVVATCTDAEQGLSLQLGGRNRYFLHRSLSVYRPRQSASGLTTTPAPAATSSYYTLQGLRVKQPRPGIYIKDGRKVVVK